MHFFSYHLIESPFLTTLKVLAFPPKAKNCKGLIFMETMAAMTLGAPLFSKSRIIMNQMAIVAQWENEASFDNFLESNNFGSLLASGWYLKLNFTRSWGSLKGLNLPENNPEHEQKGAVVAITIARMKLTQVPRFIHWGRPVEKLVRDHPGSIFSTASISLPRTVSTFSVWKSQKEMINMVHGHSSIKNPKRHSRAMKERDRKDFHFEFTTLRFETISEHGIWKGKPNPIPIRNRP